MKISRFEITLCGIIAVLWLWAAVHAIGLGRLRGPFANPEHSEKGAFFDRYDALKEAGEAEPPSP